MVVRVHVNVRMRVIFEEFRQVDGSPSRIHEGTGLGLTIAYKSAEILNGRILVKSQEARGSTFTVELPIQWENISPVSEAKPGRMSEP